MKIFGQRILRQNFSKSKSIKTKQKQKFEKISRFSNLHGFKMSNITVTPLGAGQDVGRSCLLVCIGGKRVMLDCGMHMGYNDDRRFPDFTFVSGDEPLTDYLDAVIISHFHLDHCGALPYMTEMVGYNGPIYMTGPTLAIAPIL